MSDFKFAFRQLVRNPGFTVVVVISLALGIGVNTLVFSLVNTVLLQPIPVKDPSRIANLFTATEGLPYGRSSFADYRDLRDRADVFAGVLARCYWPVSVGSASGKPVVILGSLVSGNYFEVLGVKPLLGRTFSTTEGIVEGADPVVVLSHRFWKHRLAANPGVVGQSLLVNSRAFTVIGVAPDGFTGLMTGIPEDVWIPITMKAGVHPGGFPLEHRSSGWLDIVARLKDGVGLPKAQAALNTIASQLAREFPDDDRGKKFLLVGGSLSRFPVMEMAQGVRAFMAILSIVVALVLLLTCSNVANLLLSRAAAREHEMAMRLALGAGRGRLTRQLLTESIVLALCGGAVGILFASWGLQLLGLLKPPSMIIPVGLDIPLNARVFGYTTGLSVLVGVIIGLAPAWRCRHRRLYTALRSGHPDAGSEYGHGARFQRGLVAVQVALCFILLTAAGICLKSLQATMRMDPGFDIRHGMTVGLNLSYGNYDENKGRVFYAQLLQRVRQLPGVDAASLGCIAPLSYAKTQQKVEVQGYQPQAGEPLSLEHNIVSSDYFTTLGIPILQGRPIDERDRKETEPVVVINETMARKFWGAKSPLNQTVMADGKRLRVVGVAKDGKYFQLTEVTQPHFYLSLAQVHLGFASLLVKAAGDPRTLLGPVLRELERLDPNLPTSDVKTLTQHMELQYYPTRIAALCVGAFGLLALALAAVGVYGVMAYAVRQRTHELGVRAALGANPGQILALVIRQGLMTALVGAGIGFAAALGATRLQARFLPGVNPVEPAVLVGVAGVLGAAALLACYLPAWRAAKVDPTVALRYE